MQHPDDRPVIGGNDQFVARVAVDFLERSNVGWLEGITGELACVAECFSNDQMVQFYRLLSIGQLVRLLEGEIGIGNGTPAFRAALGAVQETFDGWATRFEAATPANPIPIRKLVAVQFGAALATATFLQEQSRP